MLNSCAAMNELKGFSSFEDSERESDFEDDSPGSPRRTGVATPRRLAFTDPRGGPSFKSFSKAGLSSSAEPTRQRNPYAMGQKANQSDTTPSRHHLFCSQVCMLQLYCFLFKVKKIKGIAQMWCRIKEESLI